MELVIGGVAALLVVVAVLLVLARRARAADPGTRAAEALAARGWVPVVGGASPEWAVIEPLAVLGPHSNGRPRGLKLRVFRDPSAKVGRCAAVAEVGDQDDSEPLVRARLEQLGRSFWIGEVRPTRQQQAGTVWDYSFERLGERGLELLEKFGGGLGELAGIAVPDLRAQVEPPSGEPARSLRALLESGGVGDRLRATLHIHADAWVLTAPLETAGRDLAPVLDLAAAISATIDQAR